jgi:hypothetical protein
MCTFLALGEILGLVFDPAKDSCCDENANEEVAG